MICPPPQPNRIAKQQQDVAVPWVVDFYYLFKVQKQSLDWVAWVGSILGTAGEVFSCSEGSLKDYIMKNLSEHICLQRVTSATGSRISTTFGLPKQILFKLSRYPHL